MGRDTIICDRIIESKSNRNNLYDAFYSLNNDEKSRTERRQRNVQTSLCKGVKVLPPPAYYFENLDQFLISSSQLQEWETNDESEIISFSLPRAFEFVHPIIQTNFRNLIQFLLNFCFPFSGSFCELVNV